MKQDSSDSSLNIAGAVTMRQVAARAGVSIATVSRVLSKQDCVGDQANARVMAAVEALNYQPNRLAQGLRRAGMRKVIGVIIPDLLNPFFTEVVQGVESVLYSAGYTLLLGHSNGSTKREKTHLTVMRGEGVAGLILVPANEYDTDYEAGKTPGIPIVAVDRPPCGLKADLVFTNNQGGTREATRHLVGHGYRDIAFINGPKHLNIAQQRLAGYMEALKAGGIAIKESYIVNADFRQEGGRMAMNCILRLPKPPRAVVVANNLMTLGALQAIHDHGVQVPKEMAIVGFDDMAWAASLNPPLTVVAQPITELGATAAQLLLERLKDPKRPVRQVVLQAELRVRVSCGCPASSARGV